MILPNDCPHRRSGATCMPAYMARVAPQPCCQTTACDFEDDTPATRRPLCFNRDGAIEAYRLSWSSAFDGDVFVLVERGAVGISVQSECRSFTYGRDRFASGTDQDAWERLETALQAASFWTLNEVGEAGGMDGATWMIEGRNRDEYHSIRRWSPGGAVRHLGREFLAVAGPPMDAIELY
jgi:hypothetical protein